MSNQPTIPVPLHHLGVILAGFLSYEAHQSLKSHAGAEPGEAFHPGDPFGDVVAWLWSSGHKDHAVGLVADYLAQIRKWDELAIEEPPRRVTLEQLLRGLALALPPDTFTGPDRMALMSELRRRVPDQFSSSLDD